jgi:uncharacterized protein (UPF0332 family)
MSFDWRKYLTFAELMYEKANSEDSDCHDKETFYRCSISRAYYAVFCLARNYLKDFESQEFYSDEHKKVSTFLIKNSDSKKRKIGNQLKMLHQDRKKADYDDTFDQYEAPSLKAQKSVKMAKNIEESIDSLML